MSMHFLHIKELLSKQTPGRGISFPQSWVRWVSHQAKIPYLRQSDRAKYQVHFQSKSIFFQNYSNSIDTDELSTMFWTLFEVSGIRVTETQMMTLVTDVMQTLDEDGNDAIDIVEFVDGSLKNKFIYDLLTSADENVRKQQQQQ